MSVAALPRVSHRSRTHLGATDVTTGTEVVLSRGDVVRALLASAAIHVVFPPVRIGATRVYVLPTCALSEPPRSALGMLMHALDLRVAPPLCPLALSPVDFSQTRTHIDRARRSTERWLRAGASDPRAELVLRLHHHDSAAPSAGNGPDGRCGAGE